MCLCPLHISCVREENGAASEANCSRVRRPFAEDAVGAEVFLRTWVATERRCIILII